MGTALVAVLAASCAHAEPIVRTPGTLFPRVEAVTAPSLRTTAPTPPPTFDEAASREPSEEVVHPSVPSLGDALGAEVGGALPEGASAASATPDGAVAATAPPRVQVAALTFSYVAGRSLRVGEASGMGRPDVTGGVGPFRFAVSTGALPLGVALDATTGEITGTPGRGGEGDFTVLVVDAVGASGAFVVTVEGNGP